MAFFLQALGAVVLAVGFWVGCGWLEERGEPDPAARRWALAMRALRDAAAGSLNPHDDVNSGRWR